MSNQPGKHVDRGTAPPVVPPPARVSNLPGVPALAALAAVTVTLAVVLWLVWAPWSDDDPRQKSPAPTGPPATTFGADWSTVDGGQYRITITPSAKASAKASAGGCIPSAARGLINVAFAVRIDNLSSKEAAVPEVEFGANLGPTGSIRPAVLSLEEGSRSIELAPRAAGASCLAGAQLGPSGRDRLAENGSATFGGTVGGVSLSDAETAIGLTLIVRYPAADAADLERSTDQEFVVPFTLQRVG